MAFYKCPQCGRFHESDSDSPSQFLLCSDCSAPPAFTCACCSSQVTPEDHAQVREAFDQDPELEQDVANRYGLVHLTGLGSAYFDVDGNAVVCPSCAGIPAT